MMQRPPISGFGSPVLRGYLAMSDVIRRAQAQALDIFGLGPQERAFEVVASGPHWRLRRYAGSGTGASVLMVPAPIKRPYIWDLTPSGSAVGYCLDSGLRVHLLEWLPASEGAAGLDVYAGQAIGTCIAAVTRESDGAPPFLIGHSLGGTLATIFCALEPEAARGLVLLGAPLCFAEGSSRFRDALVSIVPSDWAETGIVPGSLLSQVSAAASPSSFTWSRLMDAALSTHDPVARDIHARVERWALDEVALPGRLVTEIIQGLYRENRFCRGTLSVCGKTVAPSDIRVPLLAIVNDADEIGPLASVAPLLESMPSPDARIIEYPGEVGVGLQHLGMLVGRQAFKLVWPQIIAWLVSRFRSSLSSPRVPEQTSESTGH